jgi:hypothetical protein
MPRVEQLHETLVLITLSTTMLTLWVEVRCHLTEINLEAPRMPYKSCTGHVTVRVG